MLLIVGLGNPGASYENTRHNVGFKIIDKLAYELSDSKTPSLNSVKWEKSYKLDSYCYKINNIILIKPTVFMNNSGVSVSKVLKYYQIPTSSIWIIHDDKDIELGKFKIHQNRGHAGHNGVKSINTAISTQDYRRYRIGIAPNIITSDKQSAATFVLGKFTADEEKILEKVTNQVIESIITSIKDKVTT